MKVSANKGEINSVCKISKVVVGGSKGIKGVGGEVGQFQVENMVGNVTFIRKSV